MTMVSNPQSIELDDIQGILVRGYGQLRYCHFFFVQVIDPEIGRDILHELIPKITPATVYDSKTSLNIAFTYTGLQAMGLSKENADNFPIPFQVGMTDNVRQRMLGDWGESDPENWFVGGKNGDEIHAMVVMYANTEAEIENFREEIRKHLSTHKSGKNAIKIVYEIGGYRREDGKENFGFHDSISNPVIKGSGRTGPDNDIIASGEFVLGYLNEHEQYPYSPLITDSQGNLNLLPPDANDSGHKDLGRNGTFIAFRQIQQHVDKFWAFMESKTNKPNGETDPHAAVKLASKIIGRWPGGAPLVKHPDQDPGVQSTDNDFGYAKEDPFGMKCPLGSHLRRNNPRDSFRDQNPKQSLKVTKRHRLIRRGRLYQTGTKGNEEYGLLFMGLNADIAQQFEFIQHVWANNLQPNKKTLYNDPDPVIGVPDPADPIQQQGDHNFRFAMQGDPACHYIEGLQRFVTIRGGAYLFLPSLSALRYLTTLGEAQLPPHS